MSSFPLKAFSQAQAKQPKQKNIWLTFFLFLRTIGLFFISKSKDDKESKKPVSYMTASL